MKIDNKYGFLQIIITYIILWIPKIVEFIIHRDNKDVFFICFMMAILVITDAKMKYNNIFIKINYWIICILFIINFIVLIV